MNERKGEGNIKYPLNELGSKKNNEIKMEIEINNNDIGQRVYFLGDLEVNSKKVNNELNSSNTEIYINYVKYEFKKYFIPIKKGIYSIMLKINSDIKTCESLFWKCENLKSVDLSSFDTKNVDNMRGMFQSCKNLTSINLSTLDTKNVKDFGSMFSFCEKLSSIDLSSFDTTNAENTEYMFAGCKNLKSVDLSSFDTKKLYCDINMFLYCNNLKQVKISKELAEKIKDQLTEKFDVIII